MRWPGHVVEMGMRDTAEWSGRLEYMGRDPKEDPHRLGKILKERVMERSGAISRDRERWKDLC